MTSRQAEPGTVIKSPRDTWKGFSDYVVSWVQISKQNVLDWRLGTSVYLAVLSLTKPPRSLKTERQFFPASTTSWVLPVRLSILLRDCLQVLRCHLTRGASCVLGCLLKQQQAVFKLTIAYVTILQLIFMSLLTQFMITDVQHQACVSVMGP